MRIVLVLLVVLGIVGPAAAVSDGDRAAIQSTIDGQLQAFLADDGATAYSFAAPGIQAMFPTVESFMSMVQNGYQPVYRPGSYSFGVLKEEGGRIEQYVDIVDGKGEFWTARYTLEQQPDGSWKIAGCSLVRKPGKVA